MKTAVGRQFRALDEARVTTPRPRTQARPRPITATAICSLVAVLSFFPLRLLHGLALILGPVLWIVLRRHRRTTLQNLTLAFPGMSPKKIRCLGKKSSVHSARTKMQTSVPSIFVQLFTIFLNFLAKSCFSTLLSK